MYGKKFSGVFSAKCTENRKCEIRSIKKELWRMENPVEWEIRAISPGKDDALKKLAQNRFQSRKKNAFTPELDMYLYLGKMAAACTVYPDLADAELQNSYGVMGEDALLKEILNIGEYNNYLSKVQEVNGFDTTMDELVEEAKTNLRRGQ